MEVTNIKNGFINDQFYTWLDKLFGWDIGIYVLVPSWTGKEIPCKFDTKSKSIYDGYYCNSPVYLNTGYYWEVNLIDNFYFLQIWETETSKKAEETPAHSYFIYKAITPSYIEDLELT